MIFVTLMGRSHEYSGLRALLVWSALPALLGYIPLYAGGVSDVAEHPVKVTNGTTEQ